MTGSVHLPLMEGVSGKDFWRRFPVPFAGIDEAGRGCLAGPVAAAAVILPPDHASLDSLAGLTDSKKLTHEQRVVLEPEIKNVSLAWGIGLAWQKEIDDINILQATFRAMAKAVKALKIRPVFLAVDGNMTIPPDLVRSLPQQAVKSGDLLVPAISAASILAKTFRDRLLTALDRKYPGYGLARHKGYGTKEHLDALRELGPCPAHRLSFRGVLPETTRGKDKQGDQQCLPGI